MNLMNMKKHFLTFFTSSMLAVTFSYADECGSKGGSCCPEQDWCSGFSLGAEFLWWHPCQNDLDYAISADNVEFDGTVNTGQGIGKYRYVNHDCVPGFRVNAVKHNALCGWDLVIAYTHVSDTEKGSTETPSEGVVLSTWFHGFHNFPIDSVTAEHKLRYQTLSAVFAYNYALNDCTHFMPFWGVEWASIKQDATSTLYGVTTAERGVVTWDSDFCAFGLKVGAEYSVAFCENFEAYAAGSATVAVADLDSDLKFVRYATTDLDELTTDMTFKNDKCVITPGYHIRFGVRYETCYCDWDMKANLGYEFLEWSNVPALRRFPQNDANVNNVGISTSSTGSTLGFHGLVAGVSMSF